MAARWAYLTVLAAAASLVLVAGPGNAQYFRSSGNEIAPSKDKGLQFNQAPVLQPIGGGIQMPSESKDLVPTPQPVELKGGGIQLPEERPSMPEIPQTPIFTGSGKEIGNGGNDDLSPLIRDAIYGFETAKNSAAQELSPLVPQAPVYLKVRIEHREKLDAVPEGYRAGNPINIKDLESLTGNNYWRKIPNEWGGTWVSEDNAIFWSRELKNVEVDGKPVLVAGREHNEFQTHRAYKRIILGYQLDSEGNQWTYEGGLTEVIQGISLATVDTNFRRDVIEDTPEKSIIRNTSTRFTVQGPLISKTVQLEQFDTTFMVAPGVRRVEASLKLFDENGEALVESHGARLWHRVAPFTVVNSYQNHDMRALFLEFLKTHNMTALIPQGAQ